MSTGRDLFSLPAGPAELCFDKNEFMKKTFSVDEFLHENRNAGSLEIIRDDLGVYLKVLRSAMIELINQDYADFVDLSANLIGLDQQIGGIGGPLEKLREEIVAVRDALEGTMGDISDCLEQKKALRGYKKGLQSLGKVHGALVKLESLLRPAAVEEINPTLLERAALESIQLQFNIKFCSEFLNQDQLNKSEELKASLLAQIKGYFLRTLKQNDLDGLERCLRIYCTLDECGTAEEVFKTEIVSPYMGRVVSESGLQNSPQGLTGIYNQILDFISLNMKNLLALTKKNGKVKGYNFIVHSFWTEVERRMETNMSSIFAPGNPESFYQKYKCTLEFLERIELIIEDPSEIAAFKAHPQYKSFQVRWNLPVYFQIRFQEIGSNLEKACGRELDAPKFTTQQISPAQFNLLQFSVALTCISSCWQDGIYLPQLFHRFLKLTLQLLSRTTTWIDTAITSPPEDPSLKLKLLATLFSDITNLSRKIPQIVNIIHSKSPPSLTLPQSSLDELFFDNRSSLTTKLNRLQTLVVQELVQAAIPHLKQVSDIPRLYRKTGREVPSRCCQYMEQMVAPVGTFRERYAELIGAERLKEFLAGVYASLTLNYYQAVDEVLVSVQKTEESLRRLKNLRDRNANPTGVTPASNTNNSSSSTTSMSDDDKIRLQLQVDVIHYVQELERSGLARGEIEKLPELIQLVEDATKIRIGGNQQQQ
ncbi:conserved oligomeric Golgi complex subunit 2 [Culex quinquefasciatus]|uniref:conserved oligomeric Golgi complex subunit 2 n=1 Tax=Culex quinquefasciatus TaxID=7176 RepID=UPI0018E2C65C|nr:conserved oligomeric Golgi complex subunit 2 [Culex quinquefasciatus]